jgi:hypothetical protein
MFAPFIGWFAQRFCTKEIIYPLRTAFNNPKLYLKTFQTRKGLHPHFPAPPPTVSAVNLGKNVAHLCAQN